ncbi:MAG: outer membrane lipoprotein-sorting protein [Deltaproteobacteria bacterium]|nr:outer membrane lipoprotein-sorting protein [Deltaproteobacteria bacterium]
MKRLTTAIFLGLLAAFWLASASFAEEKTARQIIDEMVAGLDQEDMLMQIKMVLKSKSGQTRERMLRSRMQGETGKGRSVITFEEPADVKGTKFLIIENEGRDDDQLLYLPALKKVRRIAGSQRSGSFMGTDFSYYDLSSHEVDDGTHTRQGDETLGGVDCYVVVTVPKDSEESNYSKVKYWVRKDNMVVGKAEFYDLDGKLLKTMETATYEKYKGDLWLARHLEMRNEQKGTATAIDIMKYKADASIPDDYFSERFLKDESQL